MVDDEQDFTPLRCIGCGTTSFDPTPGAEDRDEAVMTLRRFWVMAQDGSPPGLAYAVCNSCWNREIGVLWNEDGSVARTWYVSDEEST